MRTKYKDLVDLYGGLREHIMPEPPSPQSAMHYRDGYVLILQPGSHYFLIDDEKEALEPVKVDLGFVAMDPPKIEDGPEELVVTFGDHVLTLTPGHFKEWRNPPPEDPMEGL